MNAHIDSWLGHISAIVEVVILMVWRGGAAFLIIYHSPMFNLSACPCMFNQRLETLH